MFYVWKATDDQSYLEAETCFKLLLLALACCTFHTAILDALASLTRVELWWDIRHRWVTMGDSVLSYWDLVEQA